MTKRHGLVLESVQQNDLFGSSHLRASQIIEDSPSVQQSATGSPRGMATIRLPSRPTGKAGAAGPLRNGLPLSPAQQKGPAAARDSHAHFIALLRGYYDALHPDRHCGKFANIEEHFDALLRDDARVNTGKATHTKQEWRRISAQMVSSNVTAKNFIVR